ncbi:hypothetical protein D3C80_1688370 [compost metagenome]
MGNPELNDLIAERRLFTGRKDHPRIGNGQPQNGNQLLEIFILHQEWIRFQIYIVRLAQSGNRYRMRADPEPFFQVFCMHQHRNGVIFVVI